MKQYPNYYIHTYETDKCPRCNGSGKHAKGECPVCYGTGLVFVCPDCGGNGGELHYDKGRGYSEPCTTCNQSGILTLDGITEYEEECSWLHHEENMKRYRETMARAQDKTCDYCGTDCKSDCQHSRPWRGEVGQHGQTIG